MDVKCKRCGEPWEIDYFHDVAAEQETTFDQVRKNFYAKGCEAIEVGMRCDVEYENGSLIAAAQDLLGDDIDGLAATIEDFGL